MTRLRRRRESALESWAVAWALARRITASKLKDPVGIMDHVFWLPGGRPLLVEFKDPNERTDPAREELQTWYQRKFRRLGYVAVKVDTKEEFIEVMKKQGVS